MPNIEIYTRPGCGYCYRAKRLLDKRSLPYVEYDVYSSPDRLEELHDRTTNRTYPQIFINDRCIGGFDDLNALDKQSRLKL